MLDATDAFVGSETGVLKAVTFATNSFINVQNIESCDRSQKITTSCWGNESHSQVLTALANLEIRSYEPTESKLSTLFSCSKEPAIRLQCAYKQKESLIVSGTENGDVKLWNYPLLSESVNNSNSTFACPPNLKTLRLSSDHRLVSTGGRNNLLKVWDLNAVDTGPIWTAKNLAADWLQLIPDIHVTDCHFIGSDDSQLVAGTGLGQISLYDRRAQRRPLHCVDCFDHPVSSMSVCNEPHHIAVGSVQGRAGLCDLRCLRRALLHVYKGFSGGITSMEAHPIQPYLVSVALDRFIRVHHLQTRKMLHKIYLKSRPTTLLLCSTKEFSIDQLQQKRLKMTKPSDSCSGSDESSCEESGGCHSNDESDDQIWHQMTKDETSSAARRRVAIDDDDDDANINNEEYKRAKLSVNKRRQVECFSEAVIAKKRKVVQRRKRKCDDNDAKVENGDRAAVKKLKPRHNLKRKLC